MPSVAKRAWNDVFPSDSEIHHAKRRAVLRLAAQSFNRQGFKGTTLDALARRLGITKAALYHYFPNKNALLKACFDEVMDAAFENLTRAQTEGRNGRDKLRMVFAGYLAHIIDELTVAVVVMEDTALSAAERKSAHARRDRFEHALRELVVEGMQDGSIIPCDPKLVIMAMLGAVNWVPRWFRPDGEWTKEQLAEAMSSLLDRSISTVPSASLAERVADVQPHDGHGNVSLKPRTPRGRRNP